jgi:two-component system, NarL family, invasion response regulator UvrY
MAVRVLVADDHALVRKGLQQVIKEQAPDMIVDEAWDGEQVLSMVRNEEWDVLVLDIGMPKRSGLEILQELRTTQPKLPVLILSVHPEDQYAIRVLKAGAAGYLSKDSALDELVDAIRKAVSGGRYVSASLAEKLALGLSGGLDRLPHEALSDREMTVLLKMGAGMSVGEIADELSLSVKTVSTYRTRILEKMGYKSNADLIRYVIEHELLS